MDQNTKRYNFVRDMFITSSPSPFSFSEREEAFAAASTQLDEEGKLAQYTSDVGELTALFDAIIDRAIEIYEAAKAAA